MWLDADEKKEKKHLINNTDLIRQKNRKKCEISLLKFLWKNVGLLDYWHPAAVLTDLDYAGHICQQAQKLLRELQSRARGHQG